MKYKFEINGEIRTFCYNDIKKLSGAEGTMEEVIPGE